MAAETVSIMVDVWDDSRTEQLADWMAAEMVYEMVDMWDGLWDDKLAD